MALKLFYPLIMLLVCTTQGCISDDEPQGPSLKAGDSLPHFSVTFDNGVAVSTESLIGKVPVIVFFNTNCADCRKELPVVQRLYDTFQDSPKVEVLPISREEGQEEILRYWEANNLSMPFSAQENRDVYSLFAPSVIPRIYIADTQGVIKVCYDDSDMPALETLIFVISGLLQ